MKELETETTQPETQSDSDLEYVLDMLNKIQSGYFDESDVDICQNGVTMQRLYSYLGEKYAPITLVYILRQLSFYNEIEVGDDGGFPVFKPI